jgi:hypothetical protein
VPNLSADAPDQLRFSHAVHADVAECDTCHEVAAQILPKEATCLDCHEKKDDTCGTCHSRPEAPRSYARDDRHLNFSHEDHANYGADACRTCHGEPSAPSIPKHAECRQCHEGEIARSECAMCHQDLRRWPLKPVAEMAHRGDFLRTHASIAAGKGETCARCHDATFCTSCHAAQNVPLGNEWRAPEEAARAFVHRGDYVARHALEAVASPSLCVKCHDTATCESCHERNKVAGRSASSPHPPGWARPGAPGSAACHDHGAASICVSCHRPGGVGGNPHPPGWQPLGRSMVEMPCLACHL